MDVAFCNAGGLSTTMRIYFNSPFPAVDYSLPCGNNTYKSRKTGMRGCACVGGNPELCYGVYTLS